MKRALTAAALAAPVALAMAADTQLEHVHVVRAGTLHVDAPPDKAFMLFTGPGEKLWIEGWDPLVVSGDGLSRGSVFITDIGEETSWIVADFDRQAQYARYARFAPGSRIGTVAVWAESDGGDGTTVHVTYELTSLSAAGKEALEAFDEAAYAGMLQTWEQMIRDANIDYESQLFTGR